MKGFPSCFINAQLEQRFYMSLDREKSIFLLALDQSSEVERETYLHTACGEDRALRQAVDELLAAHHRSINVLDTPPEACLVLGRELGDAVAASHTVDPTVDFEEIRDPVGTLVDKYRVLERIGEGGFAFVYVAEQQVPVRRRVAMKLLKPGMETKEVLARFAAERQALAIMDHRNIARIFDAGVSEAGQPFFVMELVRGMPITEFCVSGKLLTRTRMELFVEVCYAVQHAHQKGVIHRDLKPSNVMVTMCDEIPQVKVIDFGVAKAVGEPLTDKTVYTRFAHMIGTPMYMSPEQAEMNAVDVDTRSDIYSLGILLYELLTEMTPFDRRRLRSATFDELRRIIREEEPPLPSVRLATQTGPRSSTADHWSLDHSLRGELDWVVMKAIEKDRTRRYQTAADFARDIERYLRQEPVLAKPPSSGYRIRKFAQRHRVAFVAGFLVLFALVGGTAVSVWQAIRATRANAESQVLRQEAVDFAERLKEANVLVDSARANADEKRWRLAWTQYNQAIHLQPQHYLAWSGRGSLRALLGAWSQAAGDFEEAMRLGASANNPNWWGVAQLCIYSGNEAAYDRVHASLREQLGSTGDPWTATIAARGLLIRPLPREEAQALARRLRTVRERATHLPNQDFDVPRELENFVSGLAYYRSGEWNASLKSLNQVVNSKSRFLAPRVALPVLAMTYQELGQRSEAEKFLSATAAAIDEWTSSALHGGFDQLPVSWYDFLECLLLYREAHRSIRGTLPPIDVRLAQIELQATSILSGG
jgi:eukaryotic-like serine/threonine-protein kinase